LHHAAALIHFDQQQCICCCPVGQHKGQRAVEVDRTARGSDACVIANGKGGIVVGDQRQTCRLGPEIKLLDVIKDKLARERDDIPHISPVCGANLVGRIDEHALGREGACGHLWGLFVTAFSDDYLRIMASCGQ
jgi:hypothetical protein